ncbi:SusD/RagB family nutrient-binding outer membrane lipoprotein [Flavisolibacter tropicus]|uniref:Starch-binding protein n=1 Tax=Flavisolibacter tropicus TaxID=1492898 RepID=A0A172U076_9BACT|nr:SusD/RagB family nutrient-binding outer membrane lipoprotein [Flavisolibacter tropicus]ANE52632.1 hypothetical protein SY85_21260 [Flavisolibacter tropicus]
MKKLKNILIAGAVIVALPSCKKYLDINENPNDPTSSTPELVLPQAITRTANTVPTFNFYGAQTVGYLANGGGVSGWGSIISYNYTTADFAGLWNTTYDILEDFQYVINNTEGKETYAYHNAAAKIMKAYNFELLVDTYNDVPYTEAFNGTKNLLPKYDKAQDIYKDLAVQLDAAIAQIKAAQAQTDDSKKPTALASGSDPLFKGDVNKWKQFANTLKLRLVVRGSGKVSFANTTFDAAGFLTDDAIVNPGYTKIDGKQNPLWDYFAYTAASAAVTRGGQYVPTPFILSFYDGNKVLDTVRGKLTYKEWSGTNGTSTPTNQLGSQATNAAKGATPNSWILAANATSSARGIFKAADAGQPIMLAAESYFLQAEADVRTITSNNAKANFNKGLEASFRYLMKDAAGNVLAAAAAADSAVVATTKYVTANSSNYLVNFDAATTNQEKIEAIITQKYIALNMILSHEAWNEYRRTGYPKIVAGSANSRLTFASTVSQSTNTEKLPTRLLYPESEFRYNQNNVPKGINAFTSKIFWAL